MAVVQSLDILLGWAPERTDRDQLLRERNAETAALLGRWSLGCLTAAAALGLGGIALVWHHVVPGAMCGTGVLQAMGSSGTRALIFWAAALIIMVAWQVLDDMNRHHPQVPLTQPATRLLITAAPFLTLAVFYSWQALMRSESVPPVSCCAAVYDQVLTSASKTATNQWIVPLFHWGSLAGSAALIVMAGLRIRFPDRGPGITIAATAMVWSAVTAAAVTRIWSTYYYQVLSHPCPWCLFLPDYYGAGFFIFGLMALILTHSIALWLADRTRSLHPQLADPAARRIRRSAWRVIAAVIGFTLLTAGPAILWRLRTGAWLQG